MFPHWQTHGFYDTNLLWETGNGVLNYFDGAQDWWNTRTVQINPAIPLLNVPAFTADMGFRYHFVTDSKFHDRGYLMDSINLQGDTTLTDFILDECDDLDDWVCDPLSAGSLWHWDGAQWNWWDQAFAPRQYYENMNDALVWVTHANLAYNTDFVFEYRHNLKTGEILYLEISTNGVDYDLLDTFAGNSGGWLTYSVPIDKWTGSNIWIRFRSTSDSSAAIELGYYEVRNLKIVGMVDLDAPTSACSISGTSSGGWYTSDVTVTLTASDGVTGIKAIYYKLDGGPQQTYAAPFKVTTNGGHSVEYWAEDNVGNIESPHNTCPTFQIDKGDAPTVSITSPVDDGIYLFGTVIPIGLFGIMIFGPFTVEANANDADSGVASVEFFLDGTSLGADLTSPYSMDVTAKHMGAGTIKATATDNAGNEASATLDITYFKFF